MIIPGLSSLAVQAAIAAALLAGTAWVAYGKGQESVTVKWQAERLETGKQTIRILENRTRAEQELVASAEKLKGIRDAKIRSLNSQLAATLASLHQRPERPASDPDLPEPSTPGATVGGCDGRGLYKPDAGFLARESARANRLRAELQQCYDAYDEARARTAEFNRSQGKGSGVAP